MGNMKRLFYIIVLLIIFLLSFVSAIQAQGAWIVANSNPSYPRIVCKQDSIISIQNNLLLEPQKSIYSSVYSNGLSIIQPGNITDIDRRTRGTHCKNAAFAYLINKKISGNNLITTPSNERDTLLKRALTLLNNMNYGVDSITFSNLTAYDSWQWRSKEIINYALAYDGLKGALVKDSLLLTAKANLQLFTGNLYKECHRSLLGNSFWTFNKNNFALIMCAALGTSAIVINDATSSNFNFQPSAWLYCALARTDSLFWFDVNHKSIKGKLSGYAESPYYFLYALQHLNSFFIGLNNYVNDDYIYTNYATNIKNIVQPLHDTDYNTLFDWLYLIRMPDGRVPAIDDTYQDVYNTQLALTGRRKYYTRNFYDKMSKYQSNSFINSLYGADDYKVNFLGLNYTQYNTTFNESPTQFLKDAGDIVFRSGWDSAANYMHITAESGIPRLEGGGHNQADEMSFIIHSKGQLVALDAGYIQYNQRSSVGQASNHNMLLVDGQGTTCGAPGNSGGADVTIFNAFTTPSFEYSETHTNYNNTNIVRCAMMLNKRYFALWDFASSNAIRTYTWQLHGYGLENGNDSLGYFVDSTQNGFCTWRKNDVTLQANIIAKEANPNFRKITNIHELSYNQPESHTALMVDVNNKLNLSIGAVLYPYTILTDTIENSPNLITVRNGKRKEYFSLLNETESKITGSSDAVYCKLEDDSVKLIFSRNGTQTYRYEINPGIFSAKDIIVSTAIASNLYIEDPLSQHILVYINNANTIHLNTHYIPISVTGNNLISWRLVGINKTLEMITNGEGEIVIQCNGTRIVHVGIGVNNTGETTLLIYPNPISNGVNIVSEIPIKTIALYTTNGLKILQDTTTRINLEALPAGLYMLSIETEDGVIQYRKIQKL